MQPFTNAICSVQNPSRRSLRTSQYACNNCPAMFCIMVNCVALRTDNYYFKPTLTADGLIYPYPDAFVSLSRPPSCLLLETILDIDHISQGDTRTAQMPNLHFALFPHPSGMLIKCNSHVQSFVALLNRATAVNSTI